MSEESKPTRTVEPLARRGLRALLFLLMLVWIVGGPTYRQVLGGESRYLRAWRMFSHESIGLVDASFYEQRRDGSRRLLDRFELLQVENAERPEARRIRGKHETHATALRLCGRLGPGSDVRVVSRRATRAGWVRDYTGDERLCPVRPPSKDGAS